MKCSTYAFECKLGCNGSCLCKNSYIPSNGSEGMAFMDNFCSNCIHDNPDPEKNPKCEIILRSMCYYPTEPEYPKEWIYDGLGHPKCTMFVNWNWDDDGDPNDPDNPKKLPDPPDPRQLNLFPLFHPEVADQLKLFPVK